MAQKTILSTIGGISFSPWTMTPRDMPRTTTRKKFCVCVPNLVSETSMWRNAGVGRKPLCVGRVCKKDAFRPVDNVLESNEEACRFFQSLLVGYTRASKSDMGIHS